MDGLISAVKGGFANYVNFNGKASRPDYWFWFLFVFAVTILLAAVDGALTGGLLGLLFGLGTLLPSLAYAVRRLHDTGKSGWWILICLIPVIGWLLLIFFLIQPSK